METRMNLGKVDPAAYRAMGALETYLREAGLKPSHKHLLKIRASQINGCAYCVDMHVAEAIKDGETHRRLHAVAVWKESNFFTEEERALFQLTEEVTLIQGRVSEATWNQAIALWGQSYVATLLMGVIAINAWNRIGVSTEMVPDLTSAL